jgi:glycosyltransferase involved in cell wall biosynthesis
VGGGVKVKVLEALAHGRATVTTSVGAQGLSRVCDAFVVANDPAEFAARTADLLVDDRGRHRLEAAARTCLHRLPTWDDAAGALLDAYGRLRTGDRRPTSVAVPA